MFQPTPERQRELEQKAAEARHAAARKRETHRRAALDGARHAAAVAGADRDDPLIALLCRHAIDLACAEPAFTITWLYKAAPAREAMAGQGVSFTGRGAIACAPIASVPDYAVVLHEAGHQRADQSGTQLQREISAWRWSYGNALAWNDAAEHCMRDSLGTYVLAAQQDQRPDLYGLTLAGVFLDERRSRKWPSAAALAVEAETLFRERHPSAPATCQSPLCLQAHARPVRYVGSRACCATCAALEQARREMRSPEQVWRREARARLDAHDMRRAAEQADLELRAHSEQEDAVSEPDIRGFAGPAEVADAAPARNRSATALRGIRKLKDAGATRCKYCAALCISTASVCTAPRCREIHDEDTRLNVQMKLLREARARGAAR
jgi:hypothetical protein